jgi:hypothetical protein
VRLFARLLLAAVLATPPAIVALASCSTGAVDVAACNTIEDYRCQIAPLCTPSFDVDRCLRFYRDACLNGIQNATPPNGDQNALANGCVSALGTVAACADAGTGSACPGATLVPNASCAPAANPASPTACELILDCPEALQACNFVAMPPDAGTDAAASTTSTTDAGDAGDAASE